MISISIIIPTCNRLNQLRVCLELLEPAIGLVKNTAIEIIISDDGQENIQPIINTMPLPIQYIKGPQRGPAANRNNGARMAKGDWLVFLDDDVLPQPELLAVYQQAIQDYPGIQAFEGAVFPDDEEKLKEEFAECPTNTGGGCFWSANICVQKKLFDTIGGFDEQFTIAAQEDQDFYIQIKKYTNPVFCKAAAIIHPVRKTSFKKMITGYKKSLDNYILFVNKNWAALGYGSRLNLLKIKLKETLGYLKAYGRQKKWLQGLAVFISFIWAFPYFLYYARPVK